MISGFQNADDEEQHLLRKLTANTASYPTIL